MEGSNNLGLGIKTDHYLFGLSRSVNSRCNTRLDASVGASVFIGMPGVLYHATQGLLPFPIALSNA